MDFENSKIGIDQTQQCSKINEFEYQQFKGEMAHARKYDWDGYSEISGNGSRLLFQFDGYAFLDSVDVNEQMHYWIGVSYWNKKSPDTFFELELEPFYDLITMYLNENNLPQFFEELKLIEFAGQLLDCMNKKTLLTNAH
jgi:hypothetical protein